MKVIVGGFLAAILVVFTMVGSPSYGGNITIFDNNIGASTDSTYNSWWNNRNEDQEVEPGNLTGQKWDLEAMVQDGKKLSVVGGFDFRNGVEDYYSGDLFFDTNGNAKYGSSIGTNSTNGYRTVSNSFGYDYVYDLNFSALTYDVYSINASTIVKTAYYGSNFESNPYKWVSGGTKIGSGVISYVTGKTDAETPSAFGVALTGGLHNAFTVDLGFLPFDTDFIAHFTIGCGNDSIIGDGRTPVPEPGTMMLLGSGLIGLASFGRKKLRKK